jgi:STE24 endopeptidase
MANEDKATRYHRLRRRASVAATVLVGGLLAILLLSGGAVWLRAVADGVSSYRWLAVGIYVTILVLALEVLTLPVAYYQGVTLERRYGLATESLTMWWGDRAKSVAISLVFSLVAAFIVTTTLQLSPEYWWLLSAVIFAGLLVGVAQLAPVVLMPIFFRFRPLDRPALRERLLALAVRARTDVVGVFEWQLGDRTRKANAALAGIGRTRRILVSDTLLAAHSDEEIEVILAHELAHHVHRDLWAALLLESMLVTLGLLASDRVLSASVDWLQLTGKADIAALPLVALTCGGVSLVLRPVAHALSRAHERRADRYALDMTRNPAAFVSAMKRLSAQNMAEETPSRLVEWMFHSHPSMRARIAAAQKWAAPPARSGNV